LKRIVIDLLRGRLTAIDRNYLGNVGSAQLIRLTKWAECDEA